jgi:short-subunit dehydrogenase
MSKKIVLLTGATSGIGCEIAKALSHKTILILTDRNKSKLQSHQTKYQKTGGNIFSFAMDLSIPRSITRVVKCIRTSFPRIDWIINNAGTIEHGKAATLDYGQQEVEKIFRVNVIAPYLLIKHLQTPLMKGTGGVLTIASTAGLRGNPRFPMYSASKAAQINFTESLARSDLFLKNSVKAINLIPGATNTPMRQRIAKDAKTKQSPTIIAQWIMRAITQDDIPESGSSILFLDGKISKQKSH